MKQSAIRANEFTDDPYPSRNGIPPAIIERKDPVVYGANSTASPLTQTQLEQYREQGFLVLENLFRDNEIAALQQEMVKLRTDPQLHNAEETITEAGNGEVRTIFRVHALSGVFSKLSADERLTGIARYLLDDQVYIHQSRLNYKPGFRGKEFYWHSDFETWHVEDGMPRMRALSMLITLTENYACNGSLMLIPQSHHQYVVCDGETPENHFKASLKKQEIGTPEDKFLEQLVNRGGIITATAKPGSVILFDCNLIHGSNSNITPHPRSNVFFVYNAISNAVTEPFCNRPPRPEYICTRRNIRPID